MGLFGKKYKKEQEKLEEKIAGLKAELSIWEKCLIPGEKISVYILQKIGDLRSEMAKLEYKLKLFDNQSLRLIK